MIGWLDFTLIALYLAFLLGTALAVGRQPGRQREDLILAGRRLTLPAFVATLVSTWYGGVLGVGEFSYRYGLANWLVFGVPYYLSAALFALFLAKRAQQSREVTIPERLFNFYGRPAAMAGAAVLAIVTLPVAYILMIGVLVNLTLGIPVWIGIIAGTFFSVVYVATGGFRADVKTDKVQFVLMYAGFAVLLIVAATTLGGLDYLRSHLPSGHFTATGGHSLGYIGLWYLIAMSTLVEPVFYQRCFAVKDARMARRGIFIAIAFWVLFDFMTTTCGLYARALMPDLSQPVAAFPELARKLLPPGLLGFFFVSMLAVIISTVDSYMFISSSTISHDLIWRFRPTGQENIKRNTTIALVISSLATIALTIASESVVAVWHDFGTIGNSALLIPLLTTYFGQYRFSARGALWAILLAAIISAAALLYPRLTGSPAYLLGVEPIYLGLGTSALFLFLTRRRCPVLTPSSVFPPVDR